MLGTQGAAELVKEFPFTTVTSPFVFDLKLLLLIVNLRVCIFPLYLVDASVHVWRAADRVNARSHKFSRRGEANREEYAERAGRVIGMAAETFNDGLRAYYMAFAALDVVFFAAGLCSGYCRHRVSALPARIQIGRA